MPRLFFLLFFVIATGYAGAAPDPRASSGPQARAEQEAYDRLMQKLSAYSALFKQQTVTTWCGRQYPQTAELADQMQAYLTPRFAKVEAYLYSEQRHPMVKEMMDEMEGRLDSERSEMEAGYASSYSAERCERMLRHRLKKGFGAEIEAYIES